ncbi:ras-like GTP-binding protein RHO [Paramacrobiotus metropolitanus]|uniref:ras-like GTP-binding protein RHO n=1 Tax=Paramacrobiotus metropolitanus TaxID=2943436 RepID=UPI002445ED97|nr:ras-like GTP-binding protein RHO [Paramacrobiotus metropolitanus]
MPIDMEDRTGNRKKLIVVGDGACGKTCLLYRFAENKFFEEYVPTVFESMTANFEVDGNMVELVLWDTAGQEEFDRLRPLSYPNTDVILICFSVDNPSSLDNVRNVWVPEVRHFCPKTPLVLVGNKKDLRNDRTVLEQLQKQRQEPVKGSEAKNLAEKIGAYGYYENSAKTGDGVQEVFQAACRAIGSAKKKSPTPASKRCRIL